MNCWRLSLDRLEVLKSQLGDDNSDQDLENVISEQQQIVSEISAYELKIAEARAVMADCEKRKKELHAQYRKR